MIDRFEHSPWDFWAEAGADLQTLQLETQRQLVQQHPAWAIGEHCFISTIASVHPETLALGDRSYIAAGAYLTGDIVIGADCSINPNTAVRGAVTMGDGVRIGAQTSILGFNHTMSDPRLPVHRQPLTRQGITIGDDVWIGSHVVILDGVHVGSHTVLAAGAIVTKDVPDGAIVGGNPARLLRWRIEPTPSSPTAGALASRLEAFVQTARTDLPGILDAHLDAKTGMFRSSTDGALTVRAQCDAVELADLFGVRLPVDPSVMRARLHGWVRADGSVAPLDAVGDPLPDVDQQDPDVAYHVLAVDAAAEILGSPISVPVGFLPVSDASELVDAVAALPWQANAWNGGHWVDAYGTALARNVRLGVPGAEASLAALIGWLRLHTDPNTGMWGAPTNDEGLLQPVNGFYRASRGTFVQFGVDIAHPEAVIDTVLRHAKDARFFDSTRRNACNVLDVVHPLWLTRATGYRRAEVEALTTDFLDAALRSWVPGEGFAFAVGGTPDLQGTEMWSAIIWHAADILGLEPALGIRPRGVHRPEPAWGFSPA